MEDIYIETESAYSSLDNNEIDYDNLDKYKPQGFIYICVSNGWVYPQFTLTKIGSTKCIERRKWDYFTSIPFPVNYYAYLEICYIPKSVKKFLKKGNESLLLQLVEKKIHYTLNSKKANLGGGTEFFYSENYEETLVAVMEVLSLWNIHYKLYRKDIFNKRPKKIIETKESETNIIFTEISPISEEFELRDYQKDCYELSLENDKGMFVLPPALGKSFISLKICLDYNLSCILVPHIVLVEQTYQKLQYFDTNRINVFCVSSDDQDSIEKAKIKLEKLYKKSSKEKRKLLIISTYQSSEILLTYNFDVCCFDEAHRTCVENEDGYFRNMLENGSFEKSFFFTATPKSIKFNTEHKEIEYSMENEEIYGKVLYEMKLVDAIEKGYITDYNIHMYFYPNEGVKMECLTNYLKARKGKRIFVYSSRNAMSKELLKEMNKKEILDINSDKVNVKYFQLDAKCSKKSRDKTMDEFKDYEGISVLFLCQLFGEGYDKTFIDTAFFYDICESEISLIQKMGRTFRLDDNKIKAKIVFCINRKDDRIKKLYKRLLKKLVSYDKRWTHINKSVRIGEKGWVSNTNNIILDDEGYIIDKENLDEEIKEEIYDSFMDKLIDIPVEIKFEIVEEILKEGRMPMYREIYNHTEYGDIKIGQFFFRFINNENLYKNEREKWLKIYNKYKCLKDYLEKDKEKKENRMDIPISVKFEIVEEILRENRTPTKNEIYHHSRYSDIKIGGFFSHLVNDENSYKKEREKWLKIYNKYQCFKDYLEINKDKEKTYAPISIKFEIIEEFLKENNIPARSETYNHSKYGNIKIGQFFSSFLNNEKCYKNEREKWLKIYNKYQCFKDYLEKNEEKKENKIDAPISVKFEIIEEFLKKNRIPTQKEIYNHSEYGDIKIRHFFNDFINNENRYKKEREKWLKIYNKYQCFKDYLEKNKERKENRTNIPAFVRFELLEEFLKKNNRIPTQKEIYNHPEYGNIKIGQFFNHFVNDENRYKEYREKWNKIYNKYPCFKNKYGL